MVWPFIRVNLLPFTQRCIIASLVEIGRVVLEKKIFNFCKCIYLPLEKGGSLHLNKLESPLPKDDVCQVWLKLAQRFLRRRLFKSFQSNFTIFNYLPLGKGMTIHLNRLESPLLKDALRQV